MPTSNANLESSPQRLSTYYHLCDIIYFTLFFYIIPINILFDINVNLDYLNLHIFLSVLHILAIDILSFLSHIQQHNLSLLYLSKKQILYFFCNFLIYTNILTLFQSADIYPNSSYDVKLL